MLEGSFAPAMNLDVAGHMLHMKDLRQSFLLYLRQLPVGVVPVEHVGEIVCANHQFLVVVEEVMTESAPDQGFDMIEHVKK